MFIADGLRESMRRSVSPYFSGFASRSQKISLAGIDRERRPALSLHSPSPAQAGRTGDIFMEAAQTQAERVVGKFGGVVPMSAATGHPEQRIRDWLASREGLIPGKHWPTNLAGALVNGVDHTPWDYIAHLVVIDPRAIKNVG